MPKPTIELPDNKATDLSYIQKDKDGIQWWKFKRAGGDNNMAGAGSTTQGEAFYQETVQLAHRNPAKIHPRLKPPRRGLFSLSNRTLTG